MNQMEIPHVNVLSKCDLIKNKAELEAMLDTDPRDLVVDIPIYSQKFRSLSEKIGALLSDFNLVNFIPLDVSDEDTIAAVMYQIDVCIQYGETLEVKTKDDMDIE